MLKNIIYFLIVPVLVLNIHAQKSIHKTGYIIENSSRSIMNIGNWQYWQYSNGISGIDPSGSAGGNFPKNTAGVIFQDGLMWGGYVRDNDPSKPSLRLGGQKYYTGTQPGWLWRSGNGIDPPTAVSKDNDSVRIYRIRKDIFSLNEDNLIPFLQDAKDLYYNNHPNDTLLIKIKQQYIKDWLEWPGNLGAPYYDRNRNGEWDPDYDEPGIVGADQVIWYVVNDLDETLTMEFSGSPPIGLELQVTIWAYYYPYGPLTNTIFKKYRITNKSGHRIDSMFIGQWIDPDLGDYGDDLVGCDSIWGYGFCYNGSPIDHDFNAFNMKPSAIGYILLQGALIPSLGNTAIFDFKVINDYKNLAMTSFNYLTSCDIGCEPLGGYYITLSNYNLLRGFRPIADVEDPTSFLHWSGPFYGNPTQFPLNGDPVTGTGDIDGLESNCPPSDRQMGLNSGPFSMEPGDVQEIVIAIIGANSSPDGDHIASVAKLQKAVPLIKDYYNDLLNFIPPEGPFPYPVNEFQQLPDGINFFILGENYPNPFNNTTNIRFVLYDNMKVELVIFNSMGQKVKIIHNGELDKGEHYFTWNGKDESGKDISSGIYYLHLSNDKFRAQTKKMLYLK